MMMKTQIRYRFIIILLLIALLCPACGARNSEPSASPLLTLLAGIPQDPVSQAEDFIYFMDPSAMEAAYNVTRPTSAAAFDNGRDDDKSIAWWVVRRESLGLLGETWLSLETMPELVGFSALEVDQAVQFGGVPQGLILAGSFDAKAVSAAYRTNLDFEPNDFDGETVWCWVEGCADGGLRDLSNVMRENPFGGRLGQRQPMIISNDLLTASPDLELVLAHLDATAGKLPSLADDPAYRAAVGAISKDAYILQAIIANQTLVQRMANKLPTEAWYRPGVPPGDLESYLKEFQELPPYDSLILADAVTKDEQIVRLGIVYQNAKSAEIASAILLERLAGHQSLQFRRSFAEVLTMYNVTDPRYFVHQEADRATLVLEFPTQKATSEELVQMVDFGYKGTTTRPGLLYRLFSSMFMMDDISWLSTASRAELEAIQFRTITIDAPDDSLMMLIKGAGDDYTYFAFEESPPDDWDDVSSGTLWICSEDERPPLIPKSTVNQIDGGGFLPGTQLSLTWSDQPGAPDSSELGINKIKVTIGVTYEGCIEAALKAMENESILLLTETDSMFDGKDRLMVVEFY